MTAILHALAIACYVGAAALAAAPFVRPVRASVRAVVGVLAAGAALHAGALLVLAVVAGRLPMTGLGPSLSFAGLQVALTLLVAEALAKEVTLALVAAPLAAIATGAAMAVGLEPLLDPSGVRGAWLAAHIALSFVGIAAFGTAGAAGLMYLVQRRELKSRRFGAVFLRFPPLHTLDRMNHHAAVAGWLGLTLGLVLAFTYQARFGARQPLELLWGTGAWAGVTALALGRLVGGWQARRAAIVASVSFALVVAVYVVIRVAATGGGFL